MFLNVCIDFQNLYDSFIFTDNFLEEIVDSQLKVFYILWLFEIFVVFASIFSVIYFRSALIHNVECSILASCYTILSLDICTQTQSSGQVSVRFLV
jgi:hypothetical protein